MSNRWEDPWWRLAHREVYVWTDEWNQWKARAGEPDPDTPPRFRAALAASWAAMVRALRGAHRLL